MKKLFDKFFTSHPLSLIWNIVCFKECFRNLQLRSSFRLDKIQQAQQLNSFQCFCLHLPLSSTFACPAFQYFWWNPVGTCENIMKEGVRTVRSFLRFSVQNLDKTSHKTIIRQMSLTEVTLSVYSFTIFHITPDHAGSINSSPSPTLYQTACFAVSCSNCRNSSAQVWRCWTWPALGHISSKLEFI